MPVVPAAWEVKTGGLWFETSLDKIVSRPYLKKEARKGGGGQAEHNGACL
jgi:hypothetical protein